MKLLVEAIMMMIEYETVRNAFMPEKKKMSFIERSLKKEEKDERLRKHQKKRNQTRRKWKGK
jgi:hypothetical protein